MSDEESTVRRVYVGRRLGTSGKLLYCYAAEENLDELSAYTKALAPSVPVGGILELRQTADGRFYTGPSVQVVDAITDPVWLLEWQVLDRADAQRLARAQSAKGKLAQSDELARVVDDLRAILGKTTNTAQRAALWSYIEASALR